MPIHCPVTLKRPSFEDFKELDYHVMSHAFDSHNTLGRLYDEAIYRNDMAKRLMTAGIGPVHTELAFTVTHRTFQKLYLLDVVVAETIIYELKTLQTLVAENEAQLLNYQLCLDSPRGKLINFRPPSLQYRFVNTQLTTERRHQFTTLDKRWHCVDKRCGTLRDILHELLCDWGCFLEVPLYLDALTHFLGGENLVLGNVRVGSHGELGTQRAHLLLPDVAFKLTALTKDVQSHEWHLQQFLRNSSLRALQWINLNHHQIELVTLTK